MSSKKKIKYPKIELRQKSGMSGIMTGANTELFVDGRKLPGVTAVRIEIEAGGIARAVIEMVGDFAICGAIGNLEKVVIPLVPQVFRKPLVKRSKRGR